MFWHKGKEDKSAISCMSCSNNEKTGNGTGTHIVVAQRQLQRTPAGKRDSAAHTLGYFLWSRIQPAMCHLRSPDHPPFQTQTHAHMTRQKNTRRTIQSNPWIHTLVPRHVVSDYDECMSASLRVRACVHVCVWSENWVRAWRFEQMVSSLLKG